VLIQQRDENRRTFTLGEAIFRKHGHIATRVYFEEIRRARLANQEYLCGQECSIADILVTVIANWTPNLKKPITFGPKTKALFGRVIARPAYQKAMAAENVTYKVAA
jgi:glutathione S-transferase